jgi:hypothetical protein
MCAHGLGVGDAPLVEALFDGLLEVQLPVDSLRSCDGSQL